MGTPRIEKLLHSLALLLLAALASAPALAVQARSSAIAVTPDGARVWVVNRDSNSVSVLDTVTSALLAETPVGREPRTLAITPDGAKVYVACLGSNRVDVLDGATFALLRSIAVGREPFGVAVAPNGARVYVTATSSGTVSVIDPVTDTVTSTITPGGRPRGLAVSADSSQLALTHYLTPTPSVNGVVSLFNATTLALTTNVNLPVIPPGTNLDGVPNIMQAAAYRPASTQLWLPFVASITGNANLTLQTTVRPELAIVDTSLAPPREAPNTRINLNLIVASPAVSQPVAIDFVPNGTAAVVVNQASDDVTIVAAATRTELRTVRVGSAPDGVAVSPDGARAYVSNYLSRTVSVLAISPPASAAVIGTIPVTSEPLPANILNGKKLFFTARGRMSTQNNIACTSCHPDAAHDGRDWIFTNNVGEGNRKTTDIRGIVDSGAIHWTANMDELQDLEWNIRKINFGPGLIDGLPFDALATGHNAGLSPDLDDMAAFMDSLTAPDSINPNRGAGGVLSAAAARGKQLFRDPARGCASCHRGVAGTDSDRASLVRHDVGTLAPADLNGQHGFDTMGLRNLHDAAPYLHDGTAPSLQAVLTNRNTGNRHGVTSTLTTGQVNDLASYLLAFGTEPDELNAGAGVGLPASIRLPIRARDITYTALDTSDPRQHNRIQGFSLALAFPPGAGVQAVTVAPAGVAATLPVSSVSDPPADLATGRKTYAVRFGAPIPLTMDAPGGGDIVAVAVFALAPATAGPIAVTLDPAGAALIGGTGAAFEKSESPATENLLVSNGTLTVAAPEVSSVELGAPPLLVAKSPTPGSLALAWEPVGGAAYNLYRGTLASLAAGAYDHACFLSGPGLRRRPPCRAEPETSTSLSPPPPRRSARARSGARAAAPRARTARLAPDVVTPLSRSVRGSSSRCAVPGPGAGRTGNGAL